jgi:hypothetical protein
MAKGETIEEVCRQKIHEILIQHQPPRLPARVEVEMERVVRRYVSEEFHFES